MRGPWALFAGHVRFVSPRVLHDEPSFGERLIAHLLTRASRVEEDLADQLFNSSEKRLARTLLLLANFGKEGGPQPITMDISQETLAEIIGTTRSRVQVQEAGFHRLQRPPAGPFLAAEHSPCASSS